MESQQPNQGERRWSSKEWIFWNYYASVVWTETWTCCGKHCGSWWTASWTPRFPPRSAPSTANAARSGYRNLPQPHLGHPGGHHGVAIPKLREGSYFPSLLEPRRRSEKALLAVIQQAYIEGVSTRRVDDLIKALGCDGISSSQVSRICEQLDEVVESFLGRPLDGGPYPYVWLDGLTRRFGRAVANVCVVVATGVNAVPGVDVGASEEFWLAYLADRSGAQRGGAGNLRCSPGAEERHRRGVRWGQLAALPHSLHGQPAHPSAQACPTWRGHPGPAWSAPSTSNCLPPRSTANWTEWREPFAGLLAPRRTSWPHGLPSGPLAEAVVQQPAGTAEPGDRRRRACPRKGTWWASSPTGYRRGAWWARCWPSNTTWAEARRYLTIPNAAGNEALPEPNMLDAINIKRGRAFTLLDGTLPSGSALPSLNMD